MKPSTTDIEAAMMAELDFIKNIIVTNVSWGMVLGGRPLHECDLVSVNKTGYATEIEIKTSKYDLLKDKKKKHGHQHNHLKYLYFAVPRFLEEIALAEIPERAGLYVIYYSQCMWRAIISRPAQANNTARKWNDKDKANLSRLGTMRIHKLKLRIAELSRAQQELFAGQDK